MVMNDIANQTHPKLQNILYANIHINILYLIKVDISKYHSELKFLCTYSKNMKEY